MSNTRLHLLVLNGLQELNIIAENLSPLLFLRYILLPEDQTEASVLHRESDHPLRWHLLPVNPRVLPSRPVRGEDGPGHRYPRVADSLLHPRHRGDHPDVMKPIILTAFSTFTVDKSPRSADDADCHKTQSGPYSRLVSAICRVKSELYFQSKVLVHPRATLIFQLRRGFCF